MDGLFATAVGHAVHASVLAAHEHWVAHPGSDLVGTLRQVLGMLLPAEP